MQNTIVEQAELRFLRVLNPLLRRSLPLKGLAEAGVAVVRRAVNWMDDLVEERCQNVFLLVCVLCGLAALAGGYVAGIVLGR